MSFSLPPALGTSFDDPKQYLELRKRLITCSATTKTQAAIGTISELVVPNFILNSTLMHLALPDTLWLAPPHIKCPHKADAKRDYANPFTIADAMLHATYDTFVSEPMELDTLPLSDSATSSAGSTLQSNAIDAAVTANPTSSAGSRKRVSAIPATLLEKAAKIREESDTAALTKYGDASRLIIAQIKYNLSEAANTTLEAMVKWNEAQLDNDLLRAWYVLTEAALFKNSSKRLFTERLEHALWNSDEYKLSHCDCWATFSSRWLSARVLLQLSDPTIPESRIVHHFAAALAGDPAYADVMLRLRDDDDRYAAPVASLTLARVSLIHAIEYAEHAKLRSDTLFKAKGPAVYFSSTVVTIPKVFALGNRPDSTPLCTFRVCHFGDACSRRHGEEDPRFVNGVVKPEFADRIRKSLEASKRKREQRLKEEQAKNPLKPEK